MVNIFNPLVDLQGQQLKSASWYRNAASLISDRATQGKLMRDGKLLGKPSAGRMAMFVYDPKTKQKLPFYDTFPLVLPVDTFRGGFIGLNFHYLPYGVRYKLLDQLQQFSSNTKFDQSTKLNVTYNAIKNIGIIKPAIKKYLYSYVRSSFLRVDADEMAIAIYLPVAKFKKATLGQVFADSRRKI
tara:strand:+ start:1243 stop:1797 length:555 start_codon:yes stop_codon:yes gene_type:complete